MRMLLLVLTVACSSAAPEPPIGDAPGALRMSAAKAAAEAPAAGGGAGAASPVAVRRAVIRRATLAVAVDDVVAGVAGVASATEARGGFVAASEVVPEGPAAHAEVTVRVPEAELDALIETIAASAVRVERRTLASDDVTEERVDVEAALSNQRALETRLRELLAGAHGVDEILRVEGELARVRQTIDATEGRLRALEGQIAMSTLQVHLGTGGPASVVASWSPLDEAEAALEGLLSGGRMLATVAIWGALCFAPLATLVGLPFWAWRRRRSRA